jgi:hypothetical protein
MIYVVKTKDLDPAFIKIGTARKSMSNRIKSLQTGSPHVLELIFAKNGGLKEERILHEKLKAHRVNGEWFRWNAETMRLLGLKENPKTLNPDSPKSFLTPRQKQLNHLFRKGHCYSNYIHTIEVFLSNHCYTAKDLRDFPKGKERFAIFEMTYAEASETFGSLVKHEGASETEKLVWISGLEVPNWRKIYAEKDAVFQSLKPIG